MGRFQRPFLFQSPPPRRAAKGSILNPSSVGSTRRAQNLSMYQGVKQLCPGVGAGAGRRRSACQRHRPGSHPQPYTTDERCPWKALGSSKCGTRRSASARSWRPSRRDNPFVSIGILPIYVKQRSFACCIPAFLDKLKNPAYTYNGGRVFGKTDILSLGHPICFKNKKTLSIRHHSSKQSWYSLRSSSTRSMGNLSPQPGCSMSHEHISCTSAVAFPL